MGPPHPRETFVDTYALPRSEPERERLDKQHAFVTELFGGRLIVDTTMEIGPKSRVLDAGTGAASWLLDMAQVVPETAELVGVDISTALFPKRLPNNVKLYRKSTLNLPAKWRNRFDLIHNRFLAVAFTVEQWRNASTELLRVLKPGGSIQFMEYGHYKSLAQLTSSTDMKKAIDMVDAVTNKRGVHTWDIEIDLPKVLEEVGFTDVRIETCKVPIGREWGRAGLVGAQILKGVLCGIGATLVKEGGLDGLCNSHFEIEKTICDAMVACDESPGLFIPFYAITARKASLCLVH